MAKDVKIYEKMVESNRQKSREKEENAIYQIRKMVTEHEEVTVATLVYRTGLSRAFFYNNKTVHDELVSARERQKGQDLSAHKRAVFDKAMKGKIDMLEEQLSEYSAEYNKLKDENARLRKLITSNNANIYKNL